MPSFLVRLHQKICLFLATGVGIGYLVPIGQGTIAAFATIVAIPWFLHWTWSLQAAFILLASLLGVHASTIAERHFQTTDDHKIVIDEIVSVFITFAFIPVSRLTIPLVIIGLLLNRALDIKKPLGINSLQKLPGGWGVMFDDIAVGIVCRIFLAALLALNVF